MLIIRLLLIASFCVSAGLSKGQIRAKAISYKVQIDMDKLNPDFDETTGAQRYFDFEVDTYFSDQMVRTIVRKIGKHAESGPNLRQRLYRRNAQDQYDIDHEQQYMLVKKGQIVKPRTTGKSKEILGQKCREVVFTDYRGVKISAWVASKLEMNVCPLGNFSLNGTALEVSTSNGLHYIATDFAEGELDGTFFEVPVAYEQEVVILSGDGKSK